MAVIERKCLKLNTLGYLLALSSEVTPNSRNFRTADNLTYLRLVT